METRERAQVRGYVLAGGRSRRMGTDKALLAWRGGTLLGWVASQVHDAVGSVAIVGSRVGYARLGFELLDERYAGLGPLSGLEAALRHSDVEWNLVVACDMPALRAAKLTALAAAAIESSADVCAAVRPGGGAEPLCALYRRRLLPEVQAALTDSRLRLTDLLAQWKVALWEPGCPGLTVNVNRPEEWDAMLKTGD